MALFVGGKVMKLDQKGRVTIPAPFREQLSDNELYVLTEINRGILVCGDREWFQSAKKDTSTLPNPFYKQVVVEQPVIYRIDSKGRVALHEHLINHIDTSETIFFMGMGPEFHMMSESNWSSMKDEFDIDEFDIDEFGIKDEISMEVDTSSLSKNASSWTGIRTFKEKVAAVRTTGPFVLNSMDEWIKEYEVRTSNQPPEAIFPENLLDDLRELRDQLDDIIVEIEHQRPSKAKLNKFTRDSNKWILEYTKNLSGMGKDLAYASPVFITALVFASFVGALDNPVPTLATGIIAGAATSSMLKRKNTGKKD